MDNHPSIQLQVESDKPNVENLKRMPPLWFFLGQVLTGIVLVFLLGYYLWPTLVDLVVEIANDDNYSAGLLVPLIIGYIVYRKWPAFRQPWQPSWVGLVVLAAGFGIFFLGAVLTILYISRLGMVVMLMGTIWLLGSWRVVRLLAFPFLLLALSVPLPQFFISKMTLRLQIISTQLAAEILRFLGYTVGVFGNVIDLGERQLQVVAACSGLGYLITALALGIIFCYFFQRRIWKVALLLLAMIPFAILANAFRLVIIGIWPIFEKGIWHSSIGLTVFMLGLDYLRGLNWLFNRISPEPSPAPAAQPAHEAQASAEPISLAAGSTPEPSRFASYPHLAAALVLVALVAPVAISGVEAQPVPLVQDFQLFPMEMGSWRGRHVHIDPVMVAATGASTVLNAEFANPGSKSPPVGLWIAYYENQRSGASVHSPNTCLTGSGWKTVHREVIPVAPDKSVNFAILELGGQRMAMFFWYFERGRWITSDYGHKLSIAYDRLMKQRADGALVRLTTMVQNHDDQQARQLLENFLTYLAPVLPEFMRMDQ